MENRHGGDVYRNAVQWDFSVNINPFGVPRSVKEALAEAAEEVTRYPDAEAAELTEAVAEAEGVKKEWLLFGNGASELFLAIVHALAPKKVAIPVPSFYGYEHATRAAEGEIAYLPSYKAVEKDTDLLFLANPNNPTGAVIEREKLRELLAFGEETGMVTVLDECFMDFCEEEESLLKEAERYPHLVIVRAFTKIFAVPGVRLGYLICPNAELREKIGRHLPEWNLSCFAQRAGVACAKEAALRREWAAGVGELRRELAAGLEKLGVEVVGQSRANFLLLRSEKPLYENLLEKGILIRDCRNFRGLGAGYYRVAVKTREENEVLLRALAECLR